MRLFNDTDLNDIGGLPAIRYKGGSSQTTTQTRTIPGQTTVEKNLQNSATNYANNSMGTSNSLLNNANSLIGNFNNTYDNYNNTANNVSNGYTSLLNGELPSSYAQARQQALNSQLEGTVGTAINNLGSRGILNSSVTGSALNNISKNASDTLASNYSADMSNYAGLLGNTSANNTSNLNNYTSLISSLLGDSDSLANNTSDLFNTMYSGRMGTGTTTSTTTGGGGNSTAQAVGSIGSALITCFSSGTLIHTTNGLKPIEQINIGDEVYSLDDDNVQSIETVTFVMTPSMSDIVQIETGKDPVKTTDSQRFLTEFGFEYIETIDTPIITIDGTTSIKSITKLDPELVYDFTVTGRNIFFANGLAVEGID